MVDVVNRLRASKQKTDAIIYEEARGIGRAWAEEEAELIELKAMGAAFADPENRYEDDPNAAYSPCEGLFFVICPGLEGDREAADDFWAGQIPDGKDMAGSAAFVNGFIDGALEVWEEVKDQV